MPHGTKDEWLFDQFKKKLSEKGAASSEEAKDFADELTTIITEETGYDSGL